MYNRGTGAEGRALQECNSSAASVPLAGKRVSNSHRDLPGQPAVPLGSRRERTLVSATILPDLQIALLFCRRRMWIEEKFDDLKKIGFDLEQTMLCHFERLSRLTLAVALLYVWLISIGTRTVRDSSRDLIDRTDPRDLSIFQIDLCFIERCVINALAY
jgi:hypothetical protein